MALILHIDTATEIATICISDNEKLVASVSNALQKDHAAFLQPAIKDLLGKENFSFNQLNAISVAAGPGSYTGLRVGMASAKGLCYALNIPLITTSTLEVMALSSIKTHNKNDDSFLYCPMIDARRMEVFTAVYDQHLKEIISPSAIVLSENLFEELFKAHTIVFSGSGAVKFKSMKNANTIFSDNHILPEAMAELSYKKFSTSRFADIHLAEPVYLKEFFTPQKSL